MHNIAASPGTTALYFGGLIDVLLLAAVIMFAVWGIRKLVRRHRKGGPARLGDPGEKIRQPESEPRHSHRKVDKLADPDSAHWTDRCQPLPKRQPGHAVDDRFLARDGMEPPLPAWTPADLLALKTLPTFRYGRMVDQPWRTP